MSLLKDDRIWSESFCAHLTVPKWEAPDSCKSCRLCENKFSFRRKRHNCRLCGHVVCTVCTSKRSVPVVFRLKNKTGKVRVCNKCKMECRSEWQRRQANGALAIATADEDSMMQQAETLGKGDNVIFEAARSFPVPVWKDPREVHNCAQCDKPFSSRKKHTCRLCGDVFCSKCTRKRNVPAVFRLKGKTGPTRVCSPCELRAKRNVIEYNNSNTSSRQASSSNADLTRDQMKALLKGGNTKFAPMVIVDEGKQSSSSSASMSRKGNSGFFSGMTNRISRSLTRTKTAQTQASTDNIHALLKRCNHVDIPVWVDEADYEACFNCKDARRSKRDWCRLCGELYCRRCVGLFFVPPRYTMTMPQDNKNTGHTPVPVCHGDVFKALNPGIKVTTDIMLPQWKSVASFQECFKCRRSKSRAHNCRLCGELFCSDCTSKMEIPEPFKKKAKRGPARVCDLCRFRVFKGARLLPRRVISANKRTSLEAKGKRERFQTTLEENEHAVEALLHLNENKTDKESSQQQPPSKKKAKKETKALHDSLANSLAAELAQSKDVPVADSPVKSNQADEGKGEDDISSVASASRSVLQANKFLNKLKASACSMCEMSFGLWSKRYQCNHCPKFFCARCMKDHPLQIALESAGMVGRRREKKQNFPARRVGDMKRSESAQQLEDIKEHSEMSSADSPVPKLDSVSSVADNKQLDPDGRPSETSSDEDKSASVRLGRDSETKEEEEEEIPSQPPPRARLSRLAGSKIVVKRNSVMVGGIAVRGRRATVLVGAKRGSNLLDGINKRSSRSSIAKPALPEENKLNNDNNDTEDDDSSDGEPPPLPTSAPPPIPTSAPPPIPQDEDTSSSDSSSDDGEEHADDRRDTQILEDVPIDEEDAEEYEEEVEVIDEEKISKEYLKATLVADYRTLKVLPNSEMLSHSRSELDENDPSTLFDFAERLGEGSYGAVYLAKDLRDDKMCAVKVLNVEGPDELQSLRDECNFMEHCDSPHIVSLRGQWYFEQQLYIAMEYCEAGSLSDVMEICEITFDESQIAVIMRETLLGLNYLHTHRKLHRDLKSGNILLSLEGECKLADFGVSVELQTDDEKRKTMIGTPYWMAPEVLQSAPYDALADIWSLGITALELVKGAPPNCDIHPMRAIFAIPRNPAPRLPDPENWSADFNSFIECTVQKDPEKRWSAERLLREHPFILSAGSTEELKELAVVSLPDIVAFRQEDSQEGEEEEDEDDGTMVIEREELEGIQEEDEGEEGGSYDSGTFVIGSDESGAFDSGTMVMAGSNQEEEEGSGARPQRFSQVLMKYKKRESVVYQYNPEAGGIAATGEMLPDTPVHARHSSAVVADPITDDEDEDEEECDDDDSDDFLDLT